MGKYINDLSLEFYKDKNHFIFEISHKTGIEVYKDRDLSKAVLELGNGTNSIGESRNSVPLENLSYDDWQMMIDIGVAAAKRMDCYALCIRPQDKWINKLIGCGFKEVTNGFYELEWDCLGDWENKIEVVKNGKKAVARYNEMVGQFEAVRYNDFRALKGEATSMADVYKQVERFLIEA